MKKLVSMIVLAFVFANTGFGQIKFENMSLIDAMKKAEKEEKKIFIDVYTTWCGPCKAMDANVFSDKKVGERMLEEFVCLKIDYEKGEFRQDVYSYQIKGYPTMLILDEKGIEIGRIYGSTTLEGFNMKLDTYTTKKYSPITQAFINLEDKNTGQKVWKESLGLLNDNINSFVNSDLYKDYIKACENYYTNFDIKTLEDKTDRSIFYNVTLDLKHPVVQHYLKDTNEYAKNYLHRDYMVKSFKDEVSTTKKKSKINEIKKRAEEYYDLLFKNMYGDLESKEYFMEDIFNKNKVE